MSEGPDFFCLWNRDFGEGEIQDSSGKVVWLYRHPPVSGFVKFCRNLLHASFLKRPEFIFLDSKENEILRVVQTKRFPLRRFVMTAGGSLLADIKEQSPLTDDYVVQFADHSRWSFRRPLFSARFIAVNGAERIRVHIQTHIIWYIHRGDTLDDLHLIAAIAFIHSEHCRG